ncbi:MAG: HIT domain-containing protein [bacterium]|nr:HIT domain-containing protein [candidate division KSB1 bacterium]MDH7561039.1 HIT domain-containing protein [bacterium]
MDTLWAPWRMEYIKATKPRGCIFCTKPRQSDDRRNLIPYRGAHCFVILNYYPYNNGHLMVVPYRHVADLAELTAEEQGEMMALIAQSTRALTVTLKPQGFNIGFNLGKAAGAGVEDHLHCHVVPRWVGDTNYMPILGHTKVVPDALENTCATLAEAFAELSGQKQR